MNKEAGFFLPYVLFITSLVFIVITASINIYQQDIQITHQYIDQLRIETLFQMGQAKFKEEYLPNEMGTIQVKYTFPDGMVTIVYNRIDDFQYKLHFTILTENDSYFTILSTNNIPTS